MSAREVLQEPGGWVEIGSERLADGGYDFVRDDAVHFLKSVERVDAFGINSRESYAEVDWGMEFILAARGDSASPAYFLALIKGFQGVGQLGVEGCLGKGGDGEHFSDGPNGKRRAVFVRVPQRVKTQQAFGDRQVVSVIRLAPFDSLKELRGESLQCWKRFAQEVDWVVVDRELQSPIADVPRNDAPHEVVESGSQVVDAFGGNEAEVRVRVLPNVRYEAIALALGVEVRRGAIRFAAQELGLLGLEVVEVNLCSLKPPHRPVYWVKD
jgi:hypothetical protein